MNTVTLSIGPKTYTVACAEGQETHIKALGAMIAEKYAQLGSARAPLEAQNLLFAALFLADELAEAKKHVAPKAPGAVPEPETGEIDALRDTVARLEEELNAARSTAARSAPPIASTSQFDLFWAPPAAAAANDAIADRLEALAARAEASAAALEAALASD